MNLTRAANPNILISQRKTVFFLFHLNISLQAVPCSFLMFYRPHAARGPCVTESRTCAGAIKTVDEHKFEMTRANGVM